MTSATLGRVAPRPGRIVRRTRRRGLPRAGVALAARHIATGVP